MISVKQHKGPKFDIPSFKVDGILHKKLDNFELFKLLNKSHFTVFLGKPGSGKTSLAVSFLQSKEIFRRVYESIYIFMPPNSRASLKDKFFEKLDETKVFDELDYTSLANVYDQCKEDANDGYKSLIIFDDVQKQLKDPDIQKLLLQIANNRRHSRISIWLLCQTYKSIPPQVRQVVTDFFVFKVNKSEMENLLEEQIEQHKNKFLEILNMAFTHDHDFLYINTNSQRLFKNFDKEILMSS